MAEILQKDGSWEPLTPAKETPTRPEYEKAQTDWVPAEESRLRSGSGIDCNVILSLSNGNYFSNMYSLPVREEIYCQFITKLFYFIPWKQD